MWRRKTSTKSISLIRSSTASPPGRLAFDSATTVRMKVVTQESAPERGRPGPEARAGARPGAD